ncbi:DUF427 domain-containing protein [Antrihabitans cavernicola]|uniref:DUF427 domain-containing protein n=1 Tax=Antrihabitans cavernicola TaxID=2495913 RepID=A0A5A7SAU5_9NOCA|nr:DUF427 domain-containing protein [Spelaeibacter cavernicola]KAA0022419.1 DUF427 domain-containing protein [Spelaeibacter cavernicola]
MTLTFGPGPFAKPSSGTLNGDLWSVLPDHAVFTHPVEKRIRAELAGATVADTTSAVLLHETGYLPVYYLPLADIRAEALEPSDTVTTCPFKGQARYHHLRVGDRVVPDAVWSYPEPIAGVEVLAELCSIRTDAVDQWFEEDQPVRGHPRDPFHRIDCLPSSRTVVVTAGDTELARSTRPVALFETGLPARFYIPVDDVSAELTATATSTYCPYKGEADYVAAAGIDDVAWRYQAPFSESAAIAGLVCFDPAKVTVRVDPT